jgi:hypothetical protein
MSIRLTFVPMPRPNQRSGPLAGHVRKGRVFKSPLAATDVLQIEDWVRDDLPDLLWPVLVLSELGSAGARVIITWQKQVQDNLSGLGDMGEIAECLDGRLTNLDRLKAKVPGSDTVVVERATALGLLPERVLRVLCAYPYRPAEWLTGARDFSPPEQEDIDFLVRAMVDVLSDGHRESLIKCLRTWSTVQAGTFRSSAETIDLLKYYPNDAATRGRADTIVRAMWGAHKALLTIQDSAHFADSVQWARVFWGANSMTSRCVRKRAQVENEEASVDADGSDSANRSAPSSMPEGGSHLQRLAMDLLSSYVEALETAPSHLHEHEMQEVHSGLVVRVGRDVITALGVPDVWCLEHGAHIIRVLVETRIYLQWMATQDPSIYRSFQDFGAGKAKLYAQIMEEIPEEARRPDFVQAVKEFEDLSHNSILDHRVVDTRDSFAEGKSIRTMAEESGLIDLYRQAYYMASGVAHSEWWSIETHAMERCRNVLHGGHLIPSLSLNPGGNVELARSWVDQLYTLIRLSLRVLQTDEAAVTEAFEWLETEPDAKADSDSPPPAS